MKYSLNFLLILTIALLGFACTSGETGSDIGRDFYRGNSATQSERFATYSFADQWEIYYYATTIIRPPDFSLTKYVAKNGEPMSDYITKYLNETRADMYFLNTLYVLRSMKSLSYFDYCSKPSIMISLENSSGFLKNSSLRDDYANQLSQMKC